MTLPSLDDQLGHPGHDAVRSPITVSATLRSSQYAGADRLYSRKALWGHNTESPYEEIWLDALRLSGSETVLDVGCGDGNYLAALRNRGHLGRLLGADLSDGMARAAHHAGVPVVVADVTRIPLQDASVDAILAMHMLYHVADPQVAVREVRRVLRPGGTLLASTNGARHISEIRIVMNAAARAATGKPLGLGELSFTLENGADHLRTLFTFVERRDRQHVLDISSAEPILAYIASFGPELTGVPPGCWDKFLDEAGDLIREHIKVYGLFLVTGERGVFICR